MAAADPKSPNRQKTPAEEVDTSGEQAAAAKSGCSPNQTDEAAGDKSGVCPNGELGAEDVGSDGGGSVATHSGEVGVASVAGAANKTTCVSPEDRAATEKMAESLDSQQQAFDWSETEDDEEGAKTQTKENAKSDLKVAETVNNARQDAPAEAESEKTDDGQRSPEKSPVEALRGEVDATEDRADDDEEADSTAKQRKCRWECKECGQKFSQREMFNLHRHFHAHEDELLPPTCKECGLTFQHRSSLIKHRNQHKEKEENLETTKLEDETRAPFRYQCAECKRIFTQVSKLRDHDCNNAAEKPYHCTLCRQDFQFKVSVTKHMMMHSRECTFKCQECSQTFPNIMSLRFHQKSHAALKPYECPECGMAFKHYSVMEDHRRKHVDNSRSHLCNICGKTFKYSSLLHQHQYLHTGQKPFRCPECGKKFAFAQNMKAHYRQHRQGETNSSGEPPGKQSLTSGHEAAKGPEKENTHTSEDTKRTFSCPLCPQTFYIAANLRVHMQFHEDEYEKQERLLQYQVVPNKHWEKGHTCPHCPSVFRDEPGLKGHLISVHKPTAQYLETLTAPKKQLTQLSNDNTQGKVLNIKSYKCSECGKSFRHRSVLELHMRIHSKDKPYQCKVCGKGFRFSSYLQQHLIIHTGKKPYKCPDCGKDFAFLQNMRTHQKLHQQKPFRCTSCRKGYSSETQLQQHMLSHNGDKPHKCELCDKSFGLAYLLRDHMNTHTGERPHRCEECHKSFSWFSSLLVHQKIHARKKQGLSHYNSYPSGARMRGRGKRGGRSAWGWSSPSGVSEIVAPQQNLYPVSPHRDADLHRQVRQQPLRPRVDSQTRHLTEAWPSEPHSQPPQWSADNREAPAPSQQHPQPPQYDTPTQPHHQRSPGWADVPLVGLGSAPNLDSQMKDSTSSVLGSHLPKNNSPSAVIEMTQQRQHKLSSWNSTPTSTAMASTSSLQHDFSIPTSYMDGAALWSVRPTPLTNSQSSPNKLSQDLQLPRWPGGPEPSTPLKKEERLWDISSPPVMSSTVTQPEKTWNGCEPQKPWASGLAGAPTSAQIDQSSSMPISAPSSHGVANNLWDIQSPPGAPKTVNSVEKLVNNQEFQKQVSPSWSSVQTPTQKVPISIQYEPHRFSQGIGTPVWAFQNNSVGPQTLLPGQLKPGGGQELQQPMATAAQIIINQPSPFFSPPLAPLPPLALPGPHPLHSVAVGAMPRPPHPNIFFTPQPVMTERPHMPQTLPLPQLPPQTEPHKLGSRLPFPPERLLQCMICGLSLPRELDLQMHYLQHAQGEI
ncbi:histone-lysine N-methyltransferase MECOM [Gambusia affinis]|uniref:histone-lysine N-methyltransferase MECOM n=1 Tax=Gambusia affinis TaxID=33528 RepID=UPI001CDD4F51|nr:histone-lysine N-methyltransferase MECOM [Gambusia affinis]